MEEKERESSLENEDSLDNVSKILKDSPLSNPEITFCEKTNYLEFLLSNAKDEEEKLQIKETINGYLDIYDEEDNIENEDDEN